MDIIEIIWFDAQSSLEPMTIEEAKTILKPQLTKSVGYLAYETKDYVLLVFMDFKNGLFKHWQIIPIGMIKKRNILKHKK